VLIHAEDLKKLAAAAANAATPVEELTTWRRALELLPPGSRQHQVIVEKVKALVEQVDRMPATPGAPAPSGTKKRTGVIGGIVTVLILLATKFKFALLFLLTNGKLLLLGLTKGGMLLSMFASFGVYWGVFGWKFAAGLLLSIYVHEMGHVAALRHFGIAASAPMFIPGLGAVVRLREKLHSPVEDARVGLAGPWWGFGAAVVVWAWAWLGDVSLARAIAHVSGWINLLNLTPIWQLDGSRAFRALSRSQRWMATASLLAAAVILQDASTCIAVVIAIMRCFGKDADPKGDTRTVIDYCFLTLALAAVTYGNVMPQSK
jgi:Zn-dependent protease